MCPKPNDTQKALPKKSHVEELEGIPGLFAALTEESDEEDDKWTIVTFPVDFDAVLYGVNEKNVQFYLSKFKICIMLILKTGQKYEFWYI